MSKKLLYFVVVLSFAGAAFAGQNFTDAGSDHSVCNPDNWQWGIVPNDSVTHPADLDPAWHTDCKIEPGGIAYIGTGCSIATWSFHVGVEPGHTGTLQVDGGSLSVGNWSMEVPRAGNSSDDEGSAGIIFVTGGELNPSNIWMPPGWTGGNDPNVYGYLVVMDGRVNVGGLNMSPNGPWKHSGLWLLGGVVDAAWSTMHNEGASIEVGGGVLIVDGDDTTDFQQYIDDGWITSAPYYGPPQLDYDVTNPGKTTLRAISVLDPSPADNSSVGAGVSTAALEWTIPEANVAGGTVTCDVYFEAVNPDDPDTGPKWSSLNDPATEAAYIDAGGVFGDWLPSESGLPLLESGNTTGSVTVSLEPGLDYVWKVDVFDDSTLVASHIFEFDTFNQAPVVDAGNDVTTWLDNGTVDVDIAATVTDLDTTTVSTEWTVVSQNSADAAIADAAAVDTTVTLSAVGTYVLELTADDGELQVADTVTINVYSDGCEAAKSLPDYVPLVGDLDEDCDVDLDDLALLLENWLKCVSLDECTPVE